MCYRKRILQWNWLYFAITETVSLRWAEQSRNIKCKGEMLESSSNALKKTRCLHYPCVHPSRNLLGSFQTSQPTNPVQSTDKGSNDHYRIIVSVEAIILSSFLNIHGSSSCTTTNWLYILVSLLQLRVSTDFPSPEEGNYAVRQLVVAYNSWMLNEEN